MKKIFTLIAVAMMAVGAQAQETYKVSAAPTDNQTVQATESVKLTYGADGAWQAKDDASIEGFTKFATGGQNPKDGELSSDKKSTGSGYKESSKNLPKSGVYYIFEPSATNTLTLYVQLNGEKDFFIVDGADGTNLTASVSPIFKQADGTDVTPTALSGNNSYSLSEKLVGSVSFSVEAGKKYYVFCTGSKLGLYGFTLGATTGVNGIETATAAPAVQKYVENGKLVIEKGGKKFNAAGAQLK